MKLRLLIAYIAVYGAASATDADSPFIRWGLWLILIGVASAAINPVLARLDLIDTYEKERL